MIFTMLFYVISFLLTIVGVILPSWEVWPQAFLDAITNLSVACLSLNFILPVSELFTIFLFLINFEVAYLTAKIAVKIFNYIRGTGSGLDL